MQTIEALTRADVEWLKRACRASWQTARLLPSRLVSTFIHYYVIDGLRYELFGRYADDLSGFAAFDVFDEAGTRINDRTLAEIPSPEEVRFLAARERLAHTVFIVPGEEGWRLVAAGSKVTVALSRPWWPA